MRPETEHIIELIEAQFPEEVHRKRKDKIISTLESLEVHEEYFAKFKYGNSDDLKESLSKKYNRSDGTIHDDIYRNK